MTVSLKEFLTRLGAALSLTRVRQFSAVANYIELGRWMADHGFAVDKRLPTRAAVIDEVARRVADERVLYLEFGVYRGESMRLWADRLRNPNSILHGFDSFEGLPSSGGTWHTGQFDVGGRVPVLSDPRVSFIKGWFEESLVEYEPPPHDVLVVSFDADLYSSTACVLRHLRPYIVAGTYLYFDEMDHVEHEPRAFQEFMESTGRRFELVSTHRSLAHSAFVCVE